MACEISDKWDFQKFYTIPQPCSWRHTYQVVLIPKHFSNYQKELQQCFAHCLFAYLILSSQLHSYTLEKVLQKISFTCVFDWHAKSYFFWMVIMSVQNFCAFGRQGFKRKIQNEYNIYFNCFWKADMIWNNKDNLFLDCNFI